MYHKNILPGSQHVIHQWVAATSAARLALSVVSTDVGKVCLQSDTQEMWWLASEVGPIWKPFASSGGTYYENSIDKPPVSPGALDDEFTGPSLSGWTWRNQNGGSVAASATIKDGRLHLRDATPVNSQFKWLYKALPVWASVAQTYTCKFQHDHIRSFGNTCFAVLNVAAGTGRNMRMVTRTDLAAAPTSGWQDVTNIDSGAGAEGNQGAQPEVKYMRLVRTATGNFSAYISKNGEGWANIANFVSFTADSIAIGFSTSNVSENGVTIFDWFRQT